MRPAHLLCLFVLFGNITNAQFTILPQVGLENSQASIVVNQLPIFSSSGLNLSPQAGLRMDYKFKQLHGPYIGLASSRSIVQFNFSDPANAMNAYTTERGKMQIRLEGGYQVSSKPIYFKKSGSVNSITPVDNLVIVERSSCGNYMVRKSCGSKMNNSFKAQSSGKGTWMRIQPSVGLAYIPTIPTTAIYSNSLGAQPGYTYNAGNWKTALAGGVGFELGKNELSTFVISINYLRAMGNLASKSLTTVSGNKPFITSLESKASAWNVRMGVPISLSKKKPVGRQEVIKRIYNIDGKCSQYRPRCNKAF